MSLYLFTLVLGAVGLAAMALTGVARLGHGTHHAGTHVHHGGHAGHAGHVAHHAGTGHAHHASAAQGPHATTTQQTIAGAIWSLASPRALFSLCVGFGAVGSLTQSLLPAHVSAVAALAGAFAFEFAVVRPLWNLLLRFESRPAQTLETAIFDEAQALTGFDAKGQGLVSIELDGQQVQLLATLRPEDQNARVTVRSGDRVRIEEVDSKRNRCLVSYIGPDYPGQRQA